MTPELGDARAPDTQGEVTARCDVTTLTALAELLYIRESHIQRYQPGFSARARSPKQARNPIAHVTHGPALNSAHGRRVSRQHGHTGSYRGTGVVPPTPNKLFQPNVKYHPEKPTLAWILHRKTPAATLKKPQKPVMVDLSCVGCRTNRPGWQRGQSLIYSRPVLYGGTAH